MDRRTTVLSWVVVPGWVALVVGQGAWGQAFVNVSGGGGGGSGISYLENRNRPPTFADGDNTYILQTGSAAARDFDGDGWVDLVVSRFDDTPILYRNVADVSGPGGRKFVDVTASTGFGGGAGLAVNTHINGMAWGDVDNDGRPDLYATTYAGRNHLFMNKGNGQFVDEAESRGAALPLAAGLTHKGMSVSYGDYDRDGYLDIAVGWWSPTAVNDANAGFQLLRNRGAAGPGTYEVVTQSARVDTFRNPARNMAFTPRFADLDNDGWPDLAVASDFGTSELFWNNQDGTFTDGTEAAAVNAESSAMGSSFADFDRDGDQDWFVTSIFGSGNRLYRNRIIRPGQTGTPRSFSDATNPSGVWGGGLMNAGWGWGTSFFDYDMDGWQDVIATNGMALTAAEFGNDRTRLWRNTMGGTGLVGFAEVGVANNIIDTDNGKGLVVFDLDNDGAPDVFIVNNASTPILYRNTLAGTAKFLKLRLFGVTSNADAIGAVVTISDPLLGPDLVQELSGSSNYLGQNDLSLLFGLGQFAGTIDRISIRWPSGLVQEFTDVLPGVSYRVLEGNGLLLPVATVPEAGGSVGLLMVAGAGAVATRRRRRGRS